MKGNILQKLLSMLANIDHLIKNRYLTTRPLIESAVGLSEISVICATEEASRPGFF